MFNRMKRKQLLAASGRRRQLRRRRGGFMAEQAVGSGGWFTFRPDTLRALARQSLPPLISDRLQQLRS